jgi:hypothetical protein
VVVSPAAKWESKHTVGVLATLAAIALIGLLMPVEKVFLTWLLTMAGLALFTMIAAQGLTGVFWLGWLIDEQYTMSLSRLQMFLWTVVVLSGYLTAALVNIKMGYSNVAVDIAIPQEVWLAMGISTTSLVSAPLILSKKKNETPKEESKEAMETTAVRLNLVDKNASPEQKAQVMDSHSVGKVFKNNDPKDARLYNLVCGEETNNFGILDLSRLQNLFFTLILVGAYAVSLGSYLANQTAASAFPLNAFPEISESAVALLAISHAGYLVSKAGDKQ